MRDRDCVVFLQWALPRMRMRWAGFRKVRRQVCRRLARRLAALELADLDAYRRRLAADPAEWEILDSLCRVTISRFFRDRGVFEAIGRSVLPELAARAAASGRRTVRAWSAGCASGEEPYSLAILWALSLADEVSGVALEVTATDADPHLLERARRATYPAGTLREVPTEWRQRAFEDRGRRLRLRASFAHGVVLRREDLRRAAPPGPFDLALCRNLAFTYYAEELQREVLARIAAALRPGGCLVIGNHESLPDAPPLVDPWPGARCCYRRAR